MPGCLLVRRRRLLQNGVQKDPSACVSRQQIGAASCRARTTAAFCTICAKDTKEATLRKRSFFFFQHGTFAIIAGSCCQHTQNGRPYTGSSSAPPQRSPETALECITSANSATRTALRMRKRFNSLPYFFAARLCTHKRIATRLPVQISPSSIEKDCIPAILIII